MSFCAANVEREAHCAKSIHLVKSAAPKPQAATEETPRATPSQAAPAAAPGPAPANPMASGMEGMGANPMLAALLGGQAGGAQAGNPFAGLGGNAGAAGGMPGLPPMDPSMLQNLLSNPQMMSTMTAMMSNPGFLDMVLASNPQLSGAMGPQQREMMRGMMSNPQLMQSLLPMMAAMNGIPTGQTPGQGQQQQQGTTDSTPSGMPPLPMPFLNNPALMGLMNQQGLGGSGGAPGASQVPPEERFQVQLSQLQDMGFFDRTFSFARVSCKGTHILLETKQLRKILEP